MTDEQSKLVNNELSRLHDTLKNSKENPDLCKWCIDKLEKIHKALFDGLIITKEK